VCVCVCVKGEGTPLRGGILRLIDIKAYVVTAKYWTFTF
jgi:hypothetical protein